jgi:hypothetical protein
MVMANLHVICGNCGCNDGFEYKHHEEFVGLDDEGKQWKTDLVCKNCSAIHNLDDNSVNANKIRPIPKDFELYKIKYPQGDAAFEFQEALLTMIQNAKTEHQLHNLLDRIHDVVLEAKNNPKGLKAAIKIMIE